MLDVFLDVEPIAVYIHTHTHTHIHISGNNTYITYEVVSAKEKKQAD